MGLFEELGRQVGEFTSKAKTAAEESMAVRCQECGARFSDEHDRCPECDSEDVVPAEPRE